MVPALRWGKVGKNMALRWDWNDKMGECVYEDGTTVNLYQGNGLMIAIHEHEDDTYNLAWFFVDEAHAKNMLGLTKGYDNCMADAGIKTIRLNTNYKSVPKIVSLFAKAKMNIMIELYTEEEK